jgi:hypothetical protein
VKNTSIAAEGGEIPGGDFADAKAVKNRPAVQRGVDLGREFRRNAPPTDAERKVLFGQRGSGAAEG